MRGMLGCTSGCAIEPRSAERRLQAYATVVFGVRQSSLTRHYCWPTPTYSMVVTYSTGHQVLRRLKLQPTLHRQQRSTLPSSGLPRPNSSQPPHPRLRPFFRVGARSVAAPQLRVCIVHLCVPSADHQGHIMWRSQHWQPDAIPTRGSRCRTHACPISWPKTYGRPAPPICFMCMLCNPGLTGEQCTSLHHRAHVHHV